MQVLQKITNLSVAGNRQNALRLTLYFASGSVPDDLSGAVYYGEDTEAVTALAPVFTPLTSRNDAVFIDFTQEQMAQISEYSNLYLELSYGGMVQTRGALKSDSRTESSPADRYLKLHTFGGEEIGVAIDEALSQALSVQDDVADRQGQIEDIQQDIITRQDQVEILAGQTADDRQATNQDRQQVASDKQTVADNLNLTNTYKNSAYNSAVAAGTSETNAKTSETNAAASAQTATDQAGIAVANRFVFKGSYQNNTVYAVGDGVIYANSFIRRKTAGNSGSTFVPGDWDFLAMGINLRGNWQANTYYALNDLVIFRRSAYLAPANLTTGASFSRNNWVRIAAGWNPAGAWTANTAVYEDDILTNQGSTYRVTTDHTTPASFTITNLELIAAKGDPGTLTASAFAAISLPLVSTDRIAIQRGDNTLGKIDPFTTGFPDIRPSVLLDFAGSGIVSPRLTYSRSGPAVRVNRSGLVEIVGANVPRIDFDPTTLKYLGYLAEESRSNVIANPFSPSLGASGNGTGIAPVTTSNYTTAPDGKPTAIRAQFDRGTGTTVNDSSQLNLGAGSSLTGPTNTSVWMKTNDGSTRNMTIFLGGVGQSQNFSVNGTWKRYVFTYTGAGTVTSANIYLFGNVSTDQTADISIWFPDHQAGAFPTSAIPNTGSVVARGADILRLPISRSWFNQEEGTLFVECRPQVTGNGSQALIGLGQGGANGISIRQSAAIIFGMHRSSQLPGGNDTSGSAYALATIARYAINYKNGSPVKFYNAGGSFNSPYNYLTTHSDSWTHLGIGCFADTAGPYNGHISKVAYWPKQLTDSQIQTLVQ